MKLSKSLSDNQCVLLAVAGKDYAKISISSIKDLAGEGSVCYVTLNKTHAVLKEEFARKKVNLENIVFIDAISKTFRSVPDQTDSCYFVSSPEALTEISLVISKFLRHEFTYLVFDSITSLFVYQKKGMVVKFVSSLVNKIKASKTKGVLIVLKVKGQEDLIQENAMFVDAVVNAPSKE